MVPSSAAIVAAAAGVCRRCETVATMTVSICAGSRPARSIAIRAADTDIICTVSSGEAHRRSRIPERVRIHSSEESIMVQISALSTTRRGR